MTDESIRALAANLHLAPGKMGILLRQGILAGHSEGARIRLGARSEAESVKAGIARLRWMVIVTPENWRELAANSLAFTAFPAHQEQWIDFVRPGHRMFFYVTRFSVFVAEAEVLGTKQLKPVVWSTGAFAYRVPLKPLVQVEPKQGLRIEGLISRLSFIRKKAQWGTYLRRSIIPLKETDYQIIARRFTAHLGSLSRISP
jgi:predicted RNA-binding protein